MICQKLLGRSTTLSKAAYSYLFMQIVLIFPFLSFEIKMHNSSPEDYKHDDTVPTNPVYQFPWIISHDVFMRYNPRTSNTRRDDLLHMPVGRVTLLRCFNTVL